MAISTAQRAILRAKIGDAIQELLVKTSAELVYIDDTTTLADKLTAMVTDINGKATEADITAAISEAIGSYPDSSNADDVVSYIAEVVTGLNLSQYALASDLSTVSGKVTTLIGSDADKSARVIAGEVLASAGKLERKKVSSVSDIDPTATDADKYIYMVPKSNVKSGDKYDEYMVIDGAVEKVGDWDVDLSDYIQKVTGATAGDVAVFKADGTVEDTNIKASDITDAKAVTDKLTNADVIKEITATDISNWNGKQDALTFDDAPTANSDNPVKSSGVKNALDNEAQARTTHTGDTTVHITAAERIAWNGKANIYYSATQPANLAEGDLWFELQN